MKLELRRTWFTPTATVGELYVDGLFECFTLEDQYRPEGEAKVWGETAIPLGTYEVLINHSPKFGRDLPILLNVPNFTGVRIHTGNKPKDTLGCILVGKTRLRSGVLDSKLAFDVLFTKMKEATGRITIEVKMAEHRTGTWS